MVKNKRGQNKSFSLRNFSAKNRKDFQSAIFLPKNRRGSNIDVIISFIVFIGFLVFFYVIIQPSLVTPQDKSVIINSLYTELKSNLTGANITIISVGINLQKSAQKNCIILNGFAGAANLQSPLKILVYNETGGNYPAYNSSGDVYVNMSNPADVFLNVYSSPSFVPNPTTPSGLTPCTNLYFNNQNNNYTLGKIQDYSVGYIFDANVKQLITAYDSNYLGVKSWFNVTANEDFGFNFTYQNMTSIGTNDKPPAYSSIYSESFPVLYITENNSLQSGELTVRVW